MLPKLNRLPTPEIKSVMRQGRRANGESLSFVYRKRDDALNATEGKLDPRLRGDDSRINRDDNKKATRFAFVVPMSADKRATGRNRLKRLVRESVRLALPHLVPGWEGVLVVRKDLGDSFGMVDKKVRDVLRRAGILNEPKII